MTNLDTLKGVSKKQFSNLIKKRALRQTPITKKTPSIKRKPFSQLFNK